MNPRVALGPIDDELSIGRDRSFNSSFIHAYVIGVASNVIGPSVSALPPDVRRCLGPAVKVRFTFLGYALGAAFGQ